MDVERAGRLAWIGCVDASRDVTRRSTGGVVHDEDGVALIASGSPMPYLINSASRVEPGLSGPEVVDRARAFFAPRERGFTIMGKAGVDDDVIEAAEAAGMVAVSEGSPLMAIAEPPTAIEVPSGLRVAMATTTADIDDVIEVCADSYAVYGMPPDVVSVIFDPPTVLLADHIATVIAYDDEGPVASAQAVATNGTAYLQWVATKQRAFQRGCGRLVTQSVTQAGFELGASLATLIASPMGAPLYRQLGWTDVGHCLSRIAFTPLDAP